MDELKQTSDEGLLLTFAALTHRLHAADRRQGAERLAQRIRDQRDIVEGEILRRMKKR